MKIRSVADTGPVFGTKEQYGPCPSSGPGGPVVVAIPVRNEADEIEACLQAISGQKGATADVIVLCLNNCTDGTARIVRRVACSLGTAVSMLEVLLPPDQACAGVARRIAMDRAAELAGAHGIVLTTDADGRVAPDWLAANLASLSSGADAVAGRALIEPEGAKRIPDHLHAIDARECAYAALLDELRSLLDPDPFDPWPRHDEHSGASIAVRTAIYRRVGGLPPLSLGEDRAFFDALRRVDARIRHAPDVLVSVSARIDGRAQGGMADTMRRRMQQVDAFLDDRIEPVGDALRRVRLQVQLRRAWEAGGVDAEATQRLSLRLGLPATEVAAAIKAPYFGTAWAVLEARSPVLQQRCRVALADLSTQTAIARRLCAALRARLEADLVDNALHAAAE